MPLYKKNFKEFLDKFYAKITHNHGNITNEGKITNGASKNIVTDANGNITTESKDHSTSETTYGVSNNQKYGHSKSGSNVGLADVSGGAVGTHNGLYATADHQHTLSSAYATSGHNHDGTYSKITDIKDNLTSTDTNKPLSAKQGKELKTLIDAKAVTVERQGTPESGFVATYVVKQGGTAVGSKINIPKDFLVKSASLKTCTTANTPLSGLAVNDPYLDFVINTVGNDGTDSHIYINVKDLVDTYTAGTGLTLSNGQFSLTDASNYVKKSNTTGLLKNDGSVMASGTGASNYAVGNHTHASYENVPIDTALSSTSTNPVQNKVINSALSGKLNTAAGSVGASNLASNAVEEAKIKDGAVTTNKLGASAVTSAKIADGTIANGDIANTTITGGKLVNGTITATQLASNAVEEAKIKDGAVTSAKIANGTITNDDIATQTIGMEKLAVHVDGGTSGTAGYVKLLRFTITGTYQDRPITFKVERRHATELVDCSLTFKGASNNDPGLSSFVCNNEMGFTGNGSLKEIYLYKENTSTWSLIIRKSENYDAPKITMLYNPQAGITISKIKEFITTLPTASTTNPLQEIVGLNNVSEYIEGTHGTTATGTWTGVSKKIMSLTKGTVIFFKMTSAGSGNATLNLTLADGTTTGAKEVWYNANARMTTHFPQNTVLHLVYDGSKWINTAIQNTNNFDRLIYGSQITAGETLTANTLVYARSNGRYYKVASGGTLDIRYPVIYNNQEIASGNNHYNNHNAFNSGVNIQNTLSGKTITAYQNCYLEGTLSNNIFTISDNVFVSDGATTNGKYYILLGMALNTTTIRFNSFDKSIYKCIDSNHTLVPVSNWNTIENKPSTFTPSSHTHSDNQITLTGNASNSVTPLDMAIGEVFNANRLAYLPANNIKVFYSTNNGSSWTDYGASNTDKIKLISHPNPQSMVDFIAGKGATASTNNRLYIDIDAGGGTLTSSASNLYMITRKIMIYFSTGGGGNCKVDVQTATYANSTTFTSKGIYDVHGYAGWNSIPLNVTFGGYKDQTDHIKTIRLVFYRTANNYNFSVKGLRLFGETAWITPSNLANYGHLYSYDENQIATFPSNIVASKFIKNGVNNTNLLCADGSDVARSTFVNMAQGSGNADKTLSTNANGNVILEAKNNHTHSYSASNHTHGQISNDGKITTTTDTVGNVVVTDGSNIVKVKNKIPFANLDISKANITGLGIPGSDTNTTYTASDGIKLESGVFKHNSGTGTAQTTQSVYSIKFDKFGHINAATAVSSMAPTAHTNATGSNIGQATANVFGHTKAGTAVGAADTANGSAGTDNGLYARADHVHKQSTLYATSGHNHNGTYISTSNGSVGTNNIADLAVTSDKLALDAIYDSWTTITAKSGGGYNITVSYNPFLHIAYLWGHFEGKWSATEYNVNLDIPFTIYPNQESTPCSTTWNNFVQTARIGISIDANTGIAIQNSCKYYISYSTATSSTKNIFFNAMWVY